MTLPTALGPYPIERELGRGGMGVVYLGRDPRLNRQVALKVLSGVLAQQPEHLARFEREAKLLAALNHPNIAGIYGVEQTADAQPLLVLEYVPGETLADRIARGPLPVDEALDLARQIAGAVEVAHDGGIIHRDLKPGNVKITPDGQVKVLDFGLAKSSALPDADLAQSPTFTSVPTAAGVILGTAGYMSPEQARGRAVDKRTDIWSFGCVLYECLTGRRPFDGETISDTIAHILQREPDWSALPANTPARVRELLRRCLEKDVRRRQRDIGDVRLELEDAVDSRSSSSRPVPGITMASSRGRWANLGLAVLLVSVGAIAGIAAWTALSGSAPAGGPVARPVRLSVTLPRNLRVSDYRLSPDGSQLILEASETAPDGTSNASRLFSRRLDAYAATPIAGTEGVQRFEISPDGRWLAVLSRVNVATGERRLSKVPADGSGPPIVLAHWESLWLDSFAWHGDDELLLIRVEGTDQYLFTVSATTGAVGAAVKLNHGTSGIVTGFGRRLPTGVFAQVDSFGGRGYQTSVWVLDPRTGSGTQVLENAAEAIYLDSGHLLFSRDDTIMAAPFDPVRRVVTGEITALVSGLSTPAGPADFGLARDGTLSYVSASGAEYARRLVVIDAKGSVSPYVADAGRFTMGVALTPDGTRALSTVLNPTATYEIWFADAARSTLRRTIALSKADASNGVWAPDGQSFAYYREGLDGQDGVYIQRVDRAGEPRRLVSTPSGEVLTPSSWLPDNSAVIVTRSVGQKRDIALVPVAQAGTAVPPRPLRATAANEENAVVSPDGRLIAFASDESGQQEIYVATFEAGTMGPAMPVSRGACERARWGPSSRRLYFCEPSGRVVVAEVTLTPAISSQSPTPVIDLPKFRVMPLSWDVLPDGRIVGIQRSDTEDAIPSIDIVLNWLNEIRPKLGR